MNKPFLKWAGSKRRLISRLKPHIEPVNGRLVEPFVGSGAVFLNIKAEEYILSDLNLDLINVFKLLQADSKEFIAFTKSFFNDNNNEKIFYEFREQFNSTEDVYTKSALFIYLNRHAFNGLCRYNLSGKFNVPFGRYKSIYFPEKEMIYFSKNINNCIFIHQDFRKATENLRLDDLVYLDPPYVPISATSGFVGYCPGGFNNKDQEDLALIAEKSICKFVISNNNTEFTMGLYKNADEIIELDVQKSISGNSVSRKTTKELLVIYNKEKEQQHMDSKMKKTKIKTIKKDNIAYVTLKNKDDWTRMFGEQIKDVCVQGRNANSAGKRLENFIEDTLIEKGAVSVLYSRVKSGKVTIPEDAEKILYRQVPYKKLWDSIGLSDFLLKIGNRAIRIDSRSQTVSGSVEDKSPNLIYTARDNYPEKEIVIVLDGPGVKPKIRQWMIKVAAEATHKNISVLDKVQFKTWVDENV